MSGIEATGLTKRFGTLTAVDDVTFTVRQGEVTGFLGRNGAGKTTTLRMILGLERPTSGTVTIDGRRYAELVDPLRHVGALLDARAVQPGRTAADHLLVLARSNGIEPRRVSEVLDAVGLGHVARKAAKTFSLGMLQRLGLAAALLGNPRVLVLDEPLNGLDPEGIIWFRGLLRQMAAEGRTVLISSHVMTEMSVTADRLLVIGEGRLLFDNDMATFQRDHEHEQIHVRTPDAQELRRRVAEAGGVVRDIDASAFAVTGIGGPAIGALALDAGIRLDELSPIRRSLEDAFMELTAPRNREPDAASTNPVAVASRVPSDGLRADTSAAPRRPGIRFRDALGSELTKFRSTRPGPLLVAGTLVASVGTAALFGNSVGRRYPGLDKSERRSFDPTFTVLRGRSLTQVALGILGALAVTAEFGADTILPSLAAVPDRSRFFTVKTLTTAGIGLATGLIGNTGAFLTGQALLKRRGAPSDTLRTPGSARAILGGGLHSTASALLGLGIGTLTRSTAGAIATIFGAELLVPGLAPAFPRPVSDIFGDYWPTETGARVLATRADPKLLGPWRGFGIMAAATAAVLGGAVVAFRRRDV